jgi:carbon storage regulator
MNLLAPPHADRETSTSTCPAAIERQVEERLRQSSYLSLRDVVCTAIDSVVYLHGCLQSYYLKQIAQEIASSEAGVRQVVNRIVVTKPRGGPNETSRFRSGHAPESQRNDVILTNFHPHRARDSRKESAKMLVLSRKLNQTIVINGNIRITVVGLRGNQVRLGIEAPDSIEILRQELRDRAAQSEDRERLSLTELPNEPDTVDRRDAAGVRVRHGLLGLANRGNTMRGG